MALAKELQAASGKRVLWGTAQLFKHPRYLHGAATSERVGLVATNRLMQGVGFVELQSSTLHKPCSCSCVSAGPSATVYAYAAAQVKKAMEVTKKLNGQGYVFWGGACRRG